MCRKTLFIGTIAIIFVLIVGITVSAERTIDKLKYPTLKEPEMPDIETITLDNGIIFYLIEDRQLPLVNAQLRLAAGSYLDPADKIGLADITATLMRTGGTERMTGDQVDEALESIGASIGTNMSHSSGSVSLNILSEYVDTGLELLADILRNPVFEQDKIDLAKTQERSSIARRNDEPDPTCWREFRKIIYGKDSPYARHTEYATIDNITRDDLIEFHKKYIRPDYIQMAVWGDFDKKEMIEKLKARFGDWAKSKEALPPLPEVTYEFKPGVNYIDRKNVNQSTIYIGHIGGRMNDPDYYPMIVTNNILGGAFGSRLFNNVRSKQGLAYAVQGNFRSFISYPGYYYNWCITKSESTVKAIKAIIDEIKGMQEGLATDYEMKLGKEAYLNSFVFNFEDKGEILNNIMAFDYFDYPRDFLFKAKSNVEKVTAENVLDVAKRRLHPEAFQIVVLGNADDFDEPLSVLGTVDTIDITIPTGEKAEDIAMTSEAVTRGMELLNKAAEACGGIDNFKKVTSISKKLTVTMIMPQGEIPIKAQSILLLPDRSKDILTTPMGEMISVYNGTDSWAKQGNQIVSLTEEQIEESKKDMFRSQILTFQQADNPEYQVVHIGSGEMAGKPVEIIKIISGDGEISYKMAIDPETYRPAGLYYFGETLMGPADLTEIYSDYREVSGIMIPFSKTTETESGLVAEVIIKEYIVNPQIDEAIFARPE